MAASLVVIAILALVVLGLAAAAVALAAALWRKSESEQRRGLPYGWDMRPGALPPSPPPSPVTYAPRDPCARSAQPAPGAGIARGAPRTNRFGELED